jgi:adenylosuccinate synthase
MNTIVVGLQYGDEGKGKIVDKLAETHDWVVRYQGGANAGHTLYNDSGEKIVLHQVPSGILQGKKCFIGNGCVVDLDELKKELDFLRTDHGLTIDNSNFCISPKAHVLTWNHKFADAEKNGHIGTTKKGIGPAYVDKIDRKGEQIHKFLINDVNNDYEWVRNLTVDPLLKLISSGSVLFEGAQGTMLDVDHGTYPYVTSSNCTAGGACTGTGFPPNKIDQIIGVAKCYTTRVGNGPLPTEIKGDDEEALRVLGGEYGATTGRPRRCGWLDLVQLDYACAINGVNKLYITKLDVLYKFGQAAICNYHSNGQENWTYFGSSAYKIYGTRPYAYTSFYSKDFSSLQEFSESFCHYVAKRLNVPVVASIGPRRNDLIEISV